jgi:hypothetical protein
MRRVVFATFTTLAERPSNCVPRFSPRRLADSVRFVWFNMTRPSHPPFVWFGGIVPRDGKCAMIRDLGSPKRPGISLPARARR